MSQKLLSLFLLLLLSSSLFATDKNLFLLVIDGVNRNTFYSLLHKGRLPHFQQVIDRGGYRNMDISATPNTTVDAYWELFSGERYVASENIGQQLPKELSLMERIKTETPETSIGLLLSTPQKPTPNSLTALIPHARAAVVPFPEKARTSTDTTDDILRFITNSDSPFVVIANYTSPELMARTYREGGEYYSLSILKIDRQLGRIIDELKSSNRWETSEFWITTSYPMDKGEQTHLRDHRSWVVSSQKIYRKGDRRDVFGAVLNTLGLWDEASPALNKR